ncbi:unnamed protein product [Rotaria magnacalcarata]|uniref:C2H2-type domain-containing protein n=2 Tax=Rotaria magnacalcarata TaxID=392030 RepID=A0A816XG94_9BILA|nr:unnamed protein product [Rotaria magnacalcarata]
MTTKSSPFVLYKTFIDAYMQGHSEVAKCLRHYNALAEWNQIKTNEELIKSSIEKYLEIGKKSTTIANESKPSNDNETSTTSARKRTISSDDETEIHDPLFDPDAVIPVEPTFSRRTIRNPTDEKEDETKPWVIRGIEKAKARVQAHLAKIEARRLARKNRVKAPAQEALAQEIKEISDRIANLIQVKNMGLSTEETNHTLKKLIRQKKERSTELSLLQSKQRAGLRYRQRRKKRLETLCSADTEVATELLKLYKPSTIAVHSVDSNDNVSPDLLHTIEEIARLGGVSDANHRLPNNKPCTSLDDLRDKIKERGYEIRRSSAFYRLIPAGAFSEDGKKHVTSSAVRLRKVQAIEQLKHEDCHFVSGTLQYIKDLAGTFGNDCVFYLVQDNKASIRIGRSAARGSAPLIMRLDYQISTANSTPIPASVRHQFKPIVYASCILDENGTITNAGPTYIAVRSAKHDQTIINCEETDFDRVVKLKEFERTARNHVGEIKPIIIMNVDSINPMDFTRFRKTLNLSIKKFKKYNLDAFILVTQAPGQTAFNIVERRLALLSHDLSGLVLPDNFFGTHLNISGLTVDAELEKMNFKKTGDVLAEVWNMNMIDGHQVVTEYIDPPASTNDMVRFIDTKFTLDYIIDEICDEDEEIPLHQRIEHSRPAFYPDPTMDTKPQPVYDIDEYWCATHVFQTQYTIQIIRCTKPECCGPWRSNYIQVFPHRFLPPPVPFNRSSQGVRLEKIESTLANLKPISPYYGTLFQRIQFHGIVMRGTQNQLIPFDAYCPSVQSKLDSRRCTICKQYIPSATRLRDHYKVHQQRYASKYTSCNNNSNNKEEELVDEDDPMDPSDLPLAPINISQNGVFLYVNMVDWLKSDFEDDPVAEPKSKSIAAKANAMIREEKQLVAEAAAAIAESAKLIEKSARTKTTTIQNDVIQSVATISVDNALSSNGNFDVSEIKLEQDDVSNALEQLNVADDKIDNSYDDLSDLIDNI